MPVVRHAASPDTEVLDIAQVVSSWLAEGESLALTASGSHPYIADLELGPAGADRPAS